MTLIPEDLFSIPSRLVSTLVSKVRIQQTERLSRSLSHKQIITFVERVYEERRKVVKHVLTEGRKGTIENNIQCNTSVVKTVRVFV